MTQDELKAYREAAKLGRYFGVGGEALTKLLDSHDNLTAELARVKAERDAALKDQARWKAAITGDVYIEWHETSIYVACYGDDGKYFTDQKDAITHIDAAIAAREGR